jgi:hypothetical protein
MGFQSADVRDPEEFMTAAIELVYTIFLIPAFSAWRIILIDPSIAPYQGK